MQTLRGRGLPLKRYELSVKRPLSVAFEIEGDKGKSERLEDVDEAARHLRCERARQLFGRDLDAHQLLVVADADLTEAEFVQRLFALFHDSEALRRDLDAVGDPGRQARRGGAVPHGQVGAASQLAN